MFGGSLTVQGLSSEHVRILIDGVPLVGRLNGVIDLDQINLDLFERVELIRGPTSVYYGTDSFAGVVNLIPKRIDSKRIQAQVQGLWDSVDERTLATHTGFNFGRQSVQLAAGTRMFAGIETETRKREWNERDQNWASLGYRVLFGTMELGVSTQVFDESLIDLGAVSNQSATDTEYVTDRSVNQVYTKGFINDHYLDVSLSYADYERYRDTTHIDLGTGTREPTGADPDLNRFDQWRLRGMWSHTYTWGHVFTGLDLNRESGDGPRILNQTQDLTDNALFSGVKLELGTRFQIQPSLRIADHSEFDAPITPALHVLYAGETQEVRFNYSRGFRAPSIKELYLDFHMQAGPNRYDILGNPNLAPEEGDHWSLDTQRVWLAASHSLELSGQLYYNTLNDLIALSQLIPVVGDPGRFERSYINVDHHRTKGADLHFGWAYEWMKLNLGVAHQVQYNRFSESFEIDNETDATDWSARFHLGRQKSLWQGSIFYTYRGSRPGFYTATNRTTGETTLTITESEAIHMADASITRWLGNRQLQLIAGVRNLFDVESVAHINAMGQAHAQDSVGWGRSFFIEAKYQWSSRN